MSNAPPPPSRPRAALSLALASPTIVPAWRDAIEYGVADECALRASALAAAAELIQVEKSLPRGGGAGVDGATKQQQVGLSTQEEEKICEDDMELDAAASRAPCAGGAHGGVGAAVETGSLSPAAVGLRAELWCRLGADGTNGGATLASRLLRYLRQVEKILVLVFCSFRH